MKIDLKLVLAGVAILVLFGTGMCTGYKVKKCPEITTETIIVHDTITHTIPNDIYHYVQVLKDTVIYNDKIVYKDVDTAQILKNYFATYTYERYFHDKNINIFLNDSISQNKSVGHSFKYEWLKPQVVTNNEQIIKNYRRSLYTGAGLNTLKELSVQGLYAGPRLALGVGYAPVTKVTEVKAYINLFNF